MPAKTNILPRYKSYVGRTFILRKHKNIPASTDQQAKNRKSYDREEIFGEACMVVDETNSRVRITTLSHGFLWISKFYLHKELVGQYFKDHDYVVDLSERLIRLKDVFDDIYSGDADQRDKKIDDILEAARGLRQYADTLRFPVSSSM